MSGIAKRQQGSQDDAMTVLPMDFTYEGILDWLIKATEN